MCQGCCRIRLGTEVDQCNCSIGFARFRTPEITHVIEASILCYLLAPLALAEWATLHPVRRLA